MAYPCITTIHMLAFLNEMLFNKSWMASPQTGTLNSWILRLSVCVCVCVCARARARVMGQVAWIKYDLIWFEMRTAIVARSSSLPALLRGTVFTGKLHYRVAQKSKPYTEYRIVNRALKPANKTRFWSIECKRSIGLQECYMLVLNILCVT